MSRWERFIYVLSLLAVVAGGVVYIGHVQRQSDQRWCALMSTLDEGYSVGTPTTPIGIKLQSTIGQLRRDLGC